MMWPRDEYVSVQCLLRLLGLFHRHFCAFLCRKSVLNLKCTLFDLFIALQLLISMGILWVHSFLICCRPVRSPSSLPSLTCTLFLTFSSCILSDMFKTNMNIFHTRWNLFTSAHLGCFSSTPGKDILAPKLEQSWQPDSAVWLEISAKSKKENLSL